MRRTQRGNNNAYCQDDAISWFDWSLKERHSDIYRFCRGLIHLRRTHPTLHKKRAFQCVPGMRQGSWVNWHGLLVCEPNWEYESRSLAFTLGGVDGDATFHVILNAYWEPQTFELPTLPRKEIWLRVVDTGLVPPDDLSEPGTEVPVHRGVYQVAARSAVVLMSTANPGIAGAEP